MANTQTIVVEIDPNGRASSTSGFDEQSITTSNTVREQNVTIGGLANLAAIGQSAKQVTQATFGQAGEISGNSRVQQNNDAFFTGIGYIGFGIFKPVATALLISTSLASGFIQKTIEVRNDTIESTYNNSVLGNAYNNGKIVGAG